MSSSGFRPLKPSASAQASEHGRLAEEAQFQQRISSAAAQAQELRDAIAGLKTEIIQYGLQKFESNAAKIVGRLKDALSRSSERLDFRELQALDVPTADIENNCDRFKHQLVQDQFEGRHPCQLLDNGTRVPVAYDMYSTSAADELREGTTSFSTDEAIEGFVTELTPFLSQRVVGDSFARASAAVGGLSGPPHMLTVTVSARTRGARVSYSPAYFISYAVLASPTSPVRGAILPGRYIFMVSAPGITKADKGIFDIPPTFDIDLMV